jgi:hypothetical protein
MDKRRDAKPRDVKTIPKTCLNPMIPLSSLSTTG